MDNTSSKPDSGDNPELDLYTIPSYSSWFSWDDIHEIERLTLKEFFDGSSVSRTPKIYKEYRDFIITKYREDPSRRLTFTDIRKSLVGDVSLLCKVFATLEKWGLINFGAPLPDGVETEKEDESWKVRFEEGAPSGIRVVAGPNSLKVLSTPPSVGNITAEITENGFKYPPLASYSDVFGESMRQKKLVCGNCGEHCESEYYENTKGSIICGNCFKIGNYRESLSADDSEFKEGTKSSGNEEAVWTEEETLLLLESILGHGDDWDLVTQNVKTKSKLDCISRLIELPFGELKPKMTKNNTAAVKEVHGVPSQSQETKEVKDGFDDGTNKSEENGDVDSQGTVQVKDKSPDRINQSEETGDVDTQGHPSKKRRIVSLSDVGSSLMSQVAQFSILVGSHTAAAAADAAVMALCGENPFAREIFDDDEDNLINELGSPTPNNKLDRRNSDVEISETEKEERPTHSESKETSSEKDSIPLSLRIRAAMATALGASAAHAKLLADQEDREIQLLVATIIETQLKKISCKIKHFDDLEVIMEKEYAQMEELKEYLIEERINALQRAFNAGIPRWRDHASSKSTNDAVL